MNKFISIYFIILFCLNVSYSQKCNDGVLNGDEISIDCGGLYCPKCPSDEQPMIQNIMTHSKLGLTYNNASKTLIAIDSAGTRAIISCSNEFSGYNSVFAAATDGSYFSEIFNFVTQAPGNGWRASMVDISRDGTKVLWTTGEGGIYVSDFNGENRIVAADKLRNQEDNIGEIELVTRTSPKFNANGTEIIFSHSKNGSKNRGIWKVGITEAVATKQLINIENLTESFTETIWNLGGIHDFFQLKITENNDVQFLSNLLNENSYDMDLMIYRDGIIELLAAKALYTGDINGDQHAISKDGKLSFYINPWEFNTSYYKLDHETETTSKIDLVKEASGVYEAKRLTCNHTGNLLLISGTQTGGGAVQNMLVKSGDIKYYPIHFAHGFQNSFGSIPFIVLSEMREKLVYTVGRGFPEPYEVWTTDITPHTNSMDAKYPVMSSFLIANNEIIPSHINNSYFGVNTVDGENEVVNKLIFSTFADDTLNLGYYLDPHQGSQLHNDGSSFGDMAIDNLYTHNDIFYSGQGAAATRDLPYAFSVRFSLVTDNHITSYDVYPIFMVDQVSRLNEVDDRNVQLYPTLLSGHNKTLKIKVDFPFNNASWQIYDVNGRLLSKSGSLSNLSSIDAEALSNGIYFLLLNIDKEISTKKFVILD